MTEKILPQDQNKKSEQRQSIITTQKSTNKNL